MAVDEQRRGTVIDEPAALRAVVEGTASETGEAFFGHLVKNLARALGTYGAWVTEYIPERDVLHALAFWLGDEWLPNYEFELPGTPCETVVHGQRLVHIPDRLLELYPGDREVRQAGAVSYLGLPLLDPDQRVLGHLAVLDRRPLPRDERILSLVKIFANRAVAEMLRLRVEGELREREQKLGRLFASAMDAIVELDDELEVTMANAAAERLFGGPADRLRGEPFARFLAPAAAGKLEALVRELDEPGGEPSFWLPGGLEAARLDGTPFPAEATISRFEVHGRPFYTLILRNIDDRLEAERRIHALTAQARYLREQLAAESAGVIGESPAIRQVLRDVAQVAETGATVLIHGETGTGKELIARAIHEASRRKDAPLIKVNCAAIPGSLIESELFGHERGAFTGATQRREGRFALADRGTLFLDEIGELPLDLQGKLLRVLQEGEFEPVGSSRTQKVDVRVLVATNRDLAAAVERGEFREDLFYRLNVFPIVLPPLRERGDDVVLIAAALAQTIARDLGRSAPPLGPEEVARLKAYSWPGNVRELRNVIERALITSRDGRLDLARALPDVGAGATPAAAGAPAPILTEQEMRRLERDNLVRALEATGWRAGGAHGAAARLGMHPSTLKSRMKALGIQRP